MRIVAQRVKEAKVEVEGRVVGRIGQGLLLLVGIRKGDTPEAVEELARKVAHLRIFEDESGRMNRSVLEVGGGILSVSQFTLYGDCAKGRRPNFMSAAGAEEARPLYEALNARLAEYGVEVATGEFGAKMEVALTNDGPVTLILESAG